MVAVPSNVDEMTGTMLRNLEERTSKNLDQWIQIITASKVTKHKEMINYLKSEYGLTYGYANLIALKTRETIEGAPPTGESLVDVQYSGDKSGLRPIFDAIIEGVSELVKISRSLPRKHMSACAAASNSQSSNYQRKPASMSELT